MKSLAATHRDLIDQNVGYARALAAKHFPAFAGTLEYDDALAASYEGLCSAARRFRKKHGAKFTTYAHHRMYGALIDSARSSRMLPRATIAAGEFEFDSHVEAAVHFVSPPVESLDERCDRARKGNVVRDAIERLPEDFRRLLELHYYGDMTLDEVGRKLGISKSWASRIHARALKLLQKEMKRTTADK